MAATKYSDAIRIRETKSAYNIQTEENGEWSNFIPNVQFNEILRKVIASVDKKVVDEHRSFWLEGTYGTGKSHAAAVIKHLLCDPYEEISQYIKDEFSGETILSQSLYDLRQKTRLFPVTMYGQCSISHKDDLSLQIQSHVTKALKEAGIDISVKTDYDNYVAHIEKRPKFWDDVIANNAELASYSPDRKKLVKDLKDLDKDILILVKDALRNEGVSVNLELQNLKQWFFDVQDKLAESTEYSGLLLIWDEFTDVMNSSIGHSLLVDLQDLAESTQNLKNNSYFFHIAHPSALDNLKAEDRTKTTGRYHYMHYNMEPVSAFKIMSRKFVHDNNPDNDAYSVYHEMTDRYFSMMQPVYDKYASSSNDLTETLKDLKSLFPVHPSTANLATYYAREAGSSSRSVFEFLGSNPDIREFLDSTSHFSNGDMITADYLWDFVIDEFNSKVTKYGVVTERFNSYKLHVQKQGEHYSSVFKAILLLNALNNLANNENVTPSEENIKNMFVGTPIDSEIDEILDWINVEGVVQRSPQGIYEIRFSALDLKETEEIKQKLISDKYKYTYQILEFGDVAKKDFDKTLRGVNRPYSYGFFSEDSNEYTLLNKIENGRKNANPFDLYFAFLFARSTNELSNLKDIAQRNASEDRFMNVAFFVFDVPMSQLDFDRFIEYQANATCAGQHGFAEQAKSHTDNAKAIIEDWIKNIKAGICSVYIQGEASSINSRQLPTVININISTRIFSKGPESLEILRLKAPQTCWVKQHSKGTADNVLSFNSKDEIVSRCTGPAKHMALLLQDSVDDNLKIKDDCDPNHPLLLVNRFVKSKIDHADKQNIFNLAEKLRELTYPPYGLFCSHSGYGMIAYALKPYVDKVFDTNGKPINAQRMLEIITDTFKIWDSGSNSNLHKVDLKFETKEEGSIAKGLIQLFSLNSLKDYKDVSSLTDARWALRNGYCQEVGYPLWAIKYCSELNSLPKCKDPICKLTDNIISIYTNTGTKDPHMLVETDSLLREIKYEYISLIDRNKNNFHDGFHNFLLAEPNVNLKSEDYDEAVLYIEQHMESGIGLWKEDAVIEQLKNWKLSKISNSSSSNVISNDFVDSGEHGNSDSTNQNGGIYPSNGNSTIVVTVSANDDKKQQALDKISSMSDQQIKDLLSKICDLNLDQVLDIILE